MNNQAKVLKLLLEGDKSIKNICERLGISRAQVYRILGKMRQIGLVDYSKGLAKISSPELFYILKRLDQKYDLSDLLAKSTLEFLLQLEKPSKTEKIKFKLEISRSSFYRIVSRLQELGIIEKTGDKIVLKDEDVKQLIQFIKILYNNYLITFFTSSFFILR